jgi:polyribonucleotide nucleotidyltransferase
MRTVAFYWWPALIVPGGAARGAAARLDLPVPAPSHDLARETRASLNKEGETSWKVQKSPPPKPFSTTAAGTRTVRFETGRLAQQAQGAVAAYLDEETMLLSATSAGKHRVRASTSSR